MLDIFNKSCQLTSWQGATRVLLLAVTSLALYGANSAEAALTCSQCHQNPPLDATARNNPAGRFQGSHVKHTSATEQNLACTVCHPSNSAATHSDGVVNMANPINGNTGATYSKGSFALDPTTPLVAGNCSNTYCHSAGTGGTAESGDNRSIPANTSINWGTTSGCNSCHGVGGATDGRPNYADDSPKQNDHVVGGHNKTCDVCHDSVTYSGGVYTPDHTKHNNRIYNIKATMGYTYNVGGGSCTTSGCHGTAQWGVTVLNCVSCHGAAVNITAGPLATNGNQRRAVSGEFIKTWSHSRSMNITTTANLPKELCIACHMEGDPSTGSSMASYHGNGFIELRDPDTGLTIQNVAWVSSAGAGNGWYTSTGTPMNTMAAFRRNLASATLEPEVAATQINFCLKCHDADGALSTLARTGTTNRASVTALRPFNVTIRDWTTTSAMSSLGNTGNGSGNIVDVKRSLMTSNASYHPVMGKANNGYARGARMAAPWNGTTQQMGTNTSWGYLISCWDCHAPAAATGMQTFSVTAHGAPATIRATLRGGTLGTLSSNNFCVNCHLGYAGNSNHGVAGFGTSAYQAGGSSMGGSMKSCHYCHGVGIGVSSVAVAGSATLAEALARPLRAEDVHGFESRLPQVANARWASTNRPYAFIRNTLTGWRPARSPETATNTTGNCTGIAGRTCDDNMGGRTYSPGGSY